jgi:uncharacterized membrane protein YphA (DoxX/SURF4 family)
MEILSWVGIFCILYVVMSIITFGDVITEMGIEGEDNPLVFVFAIFMMGIACLLAVFWPVYWFVKIKDKITGEKK